MDLWEVNRIVNILDAHLFIFCSKDIHGRTGKQNLEMKHQIYKVGP